jgi:malonate-semialdehyde dehydrogenase (acetylating) / methylmalonate-semialdehyde dehydrogenase
MSTHLEHEASRESTAPSNTDLIGHWIAGDSRVGDTGRTGDVADPARGALRATVEFANQAVVDEAVAAATRALPLWSDRPLSQRVAVMRNFHAGLSQKADELALLIASEHGKMVDDARGEIDRGLEVVELACSAPNLLKGEHSEQVATGVDTFSVRQPVGVCVGITPFNFPAMVPLWMFPIALVCGNTFVLKPSERNPSTSLALARILAEAGLPSGVFNVVQGDRDAVDALLKHEQVDAVSFVGSTAVARHVYLTAAASGKRVQALGGAKNHLVVLPDADLDQAADAVVSAAFGSAGQRCMAVSIVVAVGDIADELVSMIRERASRINVGPAADDRSTMGPLITAEARDRVMAHIDRGEREGAAIVADGRAVRVGGNEEGYFVGPTVLDNVKPGMAAYDEEVFGPLLGVTRTDSLDDALALIADNQYGNGAAVFTRSGHAAREFSRRVQAGMVGVNVPIPVPVGYYSFGGWGNSLFGDTHVYGPEGFHFYTRGKVITSRWPDESQGVNLAFPRA